MQQTRTINQIPRASLATFAACLPLFLMHRALTWSYIDDAATLKGLNLVKAVVVGALSDAWIAAIFAVLVAALGAAWHALGRSGAHWLAAITVLLLTVGAALHQSYVSFFHFQIAPFHIAYLTDVSFLSANGTSLIDTRVFVTLAVGSALAVAVWVVARRHQTKGLWAWISLMVLVVISLWVHNRNIKYRVQWFVPENLQAHPLERLYLSWKTMRPVDHLTPHQIRLLAEAVQNPAPVADDGLSRTELIELITKPAGNPAPGFETALRDAFKTRRDEGRKPVIAIVLMESMRPAETGYFARVSGAAPSFTPVLDQLAADGVTFKRAFSTGSVTRSGQEAVLCGYRSSRDLSLMRHPASPGYPCLTNATAGRAELIWLHGGDGRFDGQQTFWQRMGVRQLVSSADFDDAASRTGWGVGDLTFLKDAAARLHTARAATTAPQLLALMLTASHHIPWDMPADAPPHLAGIVASHPSYRTTAYADAALGAFVQRLKELELWEDTLLIITSDHGNRVAPAVSIYPGAGEQQLLQAHVNLILSGGVTAAALTDDGTKPFFVDAVVTHTDITVLAARLIGLPDFRSMSEGLFSVERRLPVMAMLEDELFEPQSGAQWRSQELIRDLPEQLVLPLYVQRALMQLAATPEAEPITPAAPP